MLNYLALIRGECSSHIGRAATTRVTARRDPDAFTYDVIVIGKVIGGTCRGRNTLKKIEWDAVRGALSVNVHGGSRDIFYGKRVEGLAIIIARFNP